MPKHIDSDSGRFDTICQMHRDIYGSLKAAGYTDESPEIVKLRKAYDMGKKMNAKLRQYKGNYDDGWYQEHKKEGPDIDKV